MPEARQRVLIQKVTPQVDCGRFAVKRVLGDRVVVETDLVADGHDDVGGVLRFRHETEEDWTEERLVPLGNDRWRADFLVDRLGRWIYTVEAWLDEFGTWQRGVKAKADAGVDVALDLLIGSELVADASRRCQMDQERHALQAASEQLASARLDRATRVDVALDDELTELVRRWPDRSHATRFERQLGVTVDPVLARFSSWYEFFPRSCGPADRPGTFSDACDMLEYIADMGFDVVYLPPIHPIGQTHRKGRNNTLRAESGDPGSPWAIGSKEGGHTSIHHELGAPDDFEAFVTKAREHRLTVALDIAFQCSPDHPWVKDHPTWFKARPDGSIQYAENPPKKYQDIYPLDFDTGDWRGLWQALLDVFLYWIDRGITVFRVDNPHTKSVQFWEWCIASIKDRHPEVVLLSEAFTRPKLMYALAKVGFSQSYTYFTWRNSSWEFREYMHELTATEVANFFRPNFWPNTPDILPPHLQTGTRGAFVSRLVLASTLSSNYGIYGPAFELMEHVARPGSEEYINNEKYEIRNWDLGASHSLRPLIARINRIRRTNPALQRMEGFAMHHCDNEQLFCYSKRDAERDNTILLVVNLDHHHEQSGWVALDLSALGLAGEPSFEVHDLISDDHYRWSGSHAFIRLNPAVMAAHIFRIVKNSW